MKTQIFNSYLKSFWSKAKNVKFEVTNEKEWDEPSPNCRSELVPEIDGRLKYDDSDAQRPTNFKVDDTMKTQIFNSYSEFLKRKDKSVNGVSTEFAESNPNWEEMNETNKGCYNCTNCDSCYNCANCYNCKSCANSGNCTNCDSCYNCANCYNCKSCANSTNCTNCDNCYN